MKPNTNSAPLQVDRPATFEEIRMAMSLSSDEPEDCTTETAWELASDFGGYVRIPSLEIETSRIIEEMIEGKEGPN
jgi:hypothetical protein